MADAGINEALQRLQNALSGRDEPRPEGFKTAQEIADEWKRDASHVAKMLKRAVEKGLWERQTVRTHGRPAYVYREIL